MSSEINKVTENKISQMLNDFEIFEDYGQLLGQIINSSLKQEKNQHESQSPFTNQNQKIIQQKQESKMTPQNKKKKTIFNEICSPTTKKQKKLLLQIDQNSTSQKNRQKQMDLGKKSNDKQIQNFYKENKQENIEAIFSQQQNCLTQNNDRKNNNNYLSQLSISDIYNQNIEKLSKNDMQEFFKALTFQISQDTSNCSSKNGSSTQSQNLYGYANFLQNMQHEHQNLNFSTQKNEQDKENQNLQKMDQKIKQESQKSWKWQKQKTLQCVQGQRFGIHKRQMVKSTQSYFL
ncbi:hypothetical protein PPERSA_04481 [Pseudocohnilembus persalinus]|uniref:Uncharacterized protein n=1 Tax=Pseudocohnilembus persalinus TaxID=266149 RepID=A0A0V0QRN9_PSEPJ|nr:hypothetical protein PPERSA_04481 [Pseudocohnilembus persalinus]|eukprot:KRX04666.1 hypothetical protein PPERSA_04481 [Pseudocohnilembus persalinus]